MCCRDRRSVESPSGFAIPPGGQDERAAPERVSQRSRAGRCSAGRTTSTIARAQFFPAMMIDRGFRSSSSRRAARVGAAVIDIALQRRRLPRIASCRRKGQ